MSVKYNIVQGTLDIETGNPWSISGNSGTSSSNFIGTTDAQALKVKTNNSDVAQFTSAGAFTLMSSSSAHLIWNNAGGGNIGANERFDNGAPDKRPRNVFIKGGYVSGNVFGSTPPYGLNLDVISGALVAGNCVNSCVFLWNTNFFNSVEQSVIGFGKEGSFTTVPGFVNLCDSSGNLEVYFSHNKRSAPRSDLVQFGSNGNLSVLAGKLLASSGIGVGNSASATIPGTVTKKIEVFDAAGASLGFLAVYDAIV